MLPVPKIAVKTWPARAVFYALALAIFSLAFQDEWDIAIAVSQPSHSLVTKVSKDPRQNHAGHGEIALAAAVAPWAPSDRPCFLTVADQQNFPALRLLRSVTIRGPPASSFI